MKGERLRAPPFKVRYLTTNGYSIKPAGMEKICAWR
jgi:hypothetical protein